MRKVFWRMAGLGCVMAGMAFAQGAGKTPDAPEETVVRTFYLRATSQQEQNEIVTALRNILDPRDRIFMEPGSAALVVSAPPEQLQLLERLLRELDTPKKLFRLTYTLSTFDGGKALGMQHYAMEVVNGQRTLVREMSQVPANNYANDAGAQYKTLDVGVSIDATPEESSGQVRVKSKVEDTSIAPDNGEGTVRRVVTRSLTLEGTIVMTLGKTVELGSLDVPGSTRHVKVEVVAELVK